jgi:predicted phosphodiesterase
MVIASSGWSLRFVALGDSQFQNPDIFAEMIAKVELLKPDLVLHVGDMIHGYSRDPARAIREWQRFADEIAPLSMPFYPVAGNHDVTNWELTMAYDAWWGPGKHFYSVDHENCHFIFLNVYWKGEFDVVHPEALEWLKNDLEQSRDADHVFVTIHSPLHLREEGKDWEHVHQLLLQYNTRAVFTGHSHIYDYQVRDGIHYFCLNTSGRMSYPHRPAGRFHQFVYATVDGEKLDLAVVGRDGIYPPDVAPPFESGRAGRYLSNTQTAIIPEWSKEPLEQEVSIPIANHADETRDFLLTWQTDDPQWSFEPWVRRATLAKGESLETTFTVRGPAGKITNTGLPHLLVQYPYFNSRGERSDASHRVQLFAPPRVKAEHLPNEAPMVLDGKLLDTVWYIAPTVNKLYIDDKGTLAPEANRIHFAYNDYYLYIGFRGVEPNPEGLSITAEGDIPLVFSDDDIEIFFDTNRDLKTYYRMMTNAAGTVLSSSPAGLFTFELDVATHIDKDFWGAEFRVPWSSLDQPGPPERGSVWGLNVRRHRFQADPPQRDWSKMQNVPYQPELFGLLEF